MMRPNGTARAYEGLSMPERIALAFHYATQDDELEILRLRDTIPRERLRLSMRVLQDGIERWRAIAAYFGIMHWRLRALCNEARFAAHVAMNPDLPNMPADAPYQLLLRAVEHEARLIALDRALETVCAEHGIDPTDIRRVNATEVYCPLMTSCAPDAGFEREQLDAMRAAVSTY